MTTFYVSEVKAVNGAGSQVDPWQLSQVNGTNIGIGDVVIFSPEADGFYRGTISLNAETNVTLKADPDKPYVIPMIRADRIVAPASWTLTPSTLEYTTPLATGLIINSVVWNWDRNLTTETLPKRPRHFGHLTKGANAAAVQASPGLWFYDSGTGVLSVSTPSGVGAKNPDVAIAPDTYAYCLEVAGTDGDLIDLFGCTGCVVDGIHTAMSLSPGSAKNGYGVHLENCVDCEWKNGTVWEGGFHAAGADGTGVTGCKLTNLISMGMNCNNVDDHAPFVLNNIGAPAGNINCTGANLEVHFYTLLGPNQQPIYPVAQLFGSPFISHGGTLLTGVKWNNCLAISYDGGYPMKFISGADTAAPSNVDDPDTYGVQANDCTYLGACPGKFAVLGNIAFRRCRVENIYAQGSNWAQIASGTKMYWECCAFAMQIDQNATRQIFQVQDASTELRFKCCSFYAKGTATTDRTRVFNINTVGPTVRCTQCVFSRENAGTLCSGVTATTAGQYVFTDCWYHNFTVYIGTAAAGTLDSEAEFKAAIDPDDIGAVYGIVPKFVDPTNGNLEPSTSGLSFSEPNLAGHQFRAVGTLLTEGITGINGKAYDGHYGAYQYDRLPMFTWSWPIPGPTRSIYSKYLVQQMGIGKDQRLVVAGGTDPPYVDFDQTYFNDHVDDCLSQIAGEISICGTPTGFKGFVILDLEGNYPYNILDPISDPASYEAAEVTNAITVYQDVIVAMRAYVPEAIVLGYHLFNTSDAAGRANLETIAALCDGVMLPSFFAGNPENPGESDAERIVYWQSQRDRAFAWKATHPTFHINMLIWVYRQNGTTLMTPAEQDQIAAVVADARSEGIDSVNLFVRAFNVISPPTYVNDWALTGVQHTWIQKIGTVLGWPKMGVGLALVQPARALARYEDD